MLIKIDIPAVFPTDLGLLLHFADFWVWDFYGASASVSRYVEVRLGFVWSSAAVKCELSDSVVELALLLPRREK